MTFTELLADITNASNADLWAAHGCLSAAPEARTHTREWKARMAAVAGEIARRSHA